jgi:hypothetical protein
MMTDCTGVWLLHFVSVQGIPQTLQAKGVLLIHWTPNNISVRPEDWLEKQMIKRQRKKQSDISHGAPMLRSYSEQRDFAEKVFSKFD